MKIGHANDLQDLFFDPEALKAAFEPPSPIHSLPIELLLKIFGYSIEKRDWSISWLRNLARVCKGWSTIIRLHPPLWAVVQVNSKIKEVKTALRKAQTYPLALVYTHDSWLPGSRWPGILRMLTSKSPQLSSVDLQIPPWRLNMWEDIVQAGLLSRVTHIRVHKTAGVEEIWSDEDWTGDMVRSRRCLEMGSGQRIQLLHLGGFGTEWDSPRLSGLVFLRLYHVDGLKRSQFERILRESPGLEEVTLFGVNLVLFEEPEERNDPIHLPLLRHFDLNDADSSFDRILRLIRAPPTASIRLNNVDVSALTGSDDPALFHIIPPTLPSAPCIFARITKDGFALVVYTSPTRRVRHNVLGMYGGITLLKPLQLGCCAPYIRKLDVDVRWKLDSTSMNSLERLCNLEILRLHGGSWVHDVLVLLSRPDNRATWPCPQIKSLDVGLRKTWTNNWMRSRFTQEDAIVLQHLVSARWRDQPNQENTPAEVARLSCLIVHVPETLGDVDEDTDNLDALVTFACKTILQGHYNTTMENGPASDDTPNVPEVHDLTVFDSTSEAFCPIHALPVELLLKIFGSTLYKPHWSTGWIRNIALACRRWNSVVTSNPSLWAVLECDSELDDILLALRKAGSSPLALVYRNDYLSGRVWSYLTSALAAQSLEFWSIDLNARSEPLERVWGDILKRILRASRKLEAMTLSHFDLAPSGRPESDEPISLPRLRYLELTEARSSFKGNSSFNQVLRLLRLPQTAEVRLNSLDVRSLTETNNPAIFRIIPPVLPSTPCISARITNGGFALLAYISPTRRVRHNVHGRSGGATLLKPLQLGCCAPLIKKLDVDMRRPIHPDSMDCLERLCNLENLRVHGGFWVHVVLRILSSPQTAATSSWPCPKINSLDVGFREAGKKNWMHSSFTSEDASVLQDLVSARWGDGNGFTNVARLSSLMVHVPDTFGAISEQSEDLDALVTFACTSARVLGPNVLRIVSTGS
ncbi:hypothetical protein FRB90_012045 [Tulasnella sp. 427]|nr:hypothetical protein FRB90_012045 [Tulasnella sp. 427]